MVKFGMPMLFELPNLASNIEMCLRLDLNVLELSMNLPEYCPEAFPARAAREAMKQSGIAFTLHLPEELDLGTFHAPLRYGCLARAVDAVRWAGEAGVRLVNMHLNTGVYFTLPDRRVYVYERDYSHYHDNLMQSMEALSAEVETCGVTLCVENTGHSGLRHMQEPLQEMAEAGLVGLTWDTGHDGAAGLADKPFMLSNLRHLRHMHLHDYTHGRDHLPLFTGDLDITEALSIADRGDLTVIVEVKTAAALERSVIRLKEWLKTSKNVTALT